MTHPDLLTDEDLATREKTPKGYFNQFISIVEDKSICCATCKQVLASQKGKIFFSCCPATFPTYEEALADTDTTCAQEGDQLCDYMGTFEL